MRLKNLMVYLFIGFTVTSCIKEEAPNAEADIETCTVPGDVLNRTPIIGDEQITLILKTGADITKLAPEFTLTAGATINPASGTVRDFTTPQTSFLVFQLLFISKRLFPTLVKTAVLYITTFERLTFSGITWIGLMPMQVLTTQG